MLAQAGVAAQIGLDPFAPEVLGNPYAYHEALREAGPVLWFAQYGIYGVARHAQVREVLGDWQTYCSSRGVGLADFARETPFRTPSLLLERDPPLHALARGVMNKVVALPRLRVLAEAWRGVARDLVDAAVAHGTFDAVTDLAEAFPLRIFPDTLGLPTEGRHHLLPYATSVFNAFGPRNAVFDAAMAGIEAAQAWIAEACRYDNLRPGGWGRDVHDFAREAGLAGAEGELLVRSFLSAGVDTTVNGIGNMIHAFARHPEAWDAVRANPALRKRAFDEALRWEGTAQAFFRTTTRAVELGGVAIPEGAKIVTFLGAANRDPRHWPDADRFDVTRVASGHVGFGYGIHQCLGQMIARQEAEVVLEALVERVRSLRVAGPPTRRINNTLYALASLPVTVEPA